MIILITRPNHDELLNYLYHWCQPIINLALKKDFQLIDLSGKKATNGLLHQYLRKIKPSFYMLNGHGNSDGIYGDDNYPIIESNDKLEEFKHGIFYCRSCDSGQNLGPLLIKSGAKGFIGYDRKFTVAYFPNYLTKPMQDPLARLFIEPSNQVPLSLIKGHTISEAYQKSQKMMRINLRKMLSSNASYEERSSAMFLWSNIKHQVILGDTNATL
jgi:hypothetical protein